MLIGLLSDTHIRVPGTRSNLGQLWGDTLPLQISEAFRGVDLILHAGDIYTLPVLEELEKVAPVLAAEGDDDPFEIVNDKRVKSKHILNIEGITIGLAHQFETWDLSKQDKLPDVIVFGHLHKSSLETLNGVLWVNPGSPTFPNYKYELGTVALLTVNNGKTEAQIIKLQGALGGAGGSKMLR
jgi:putative phosphoesterase